MKIPQILLLTLNLLCYPRECVGFGQLRGDLKLRKFNYPLNYRYGINLQIARKTPHLVFLTLLAGDVATNPGPLTKSTEMNPAQGHSFRRQTDALNVLYLNARSLKAFVPSNTDCTSKQCKITLLQHLVYSATYDIVCICETWLNAIVLSSELLPGFSIFRRDRVGKIGGGVLVAVKNNILTYMQLVDLISKNKTRNSPLSNLRYRIANQPCYTLSIVLLTLVPMQYNT